MGRKQQVSHIDFPPFFHHYLLFLPAQTSANSSYKSISTSNALEARKKSFLVVLRGTLASFLDENTVILVLLFSLMIKKTPFGDFLCVCRDVRRSMENAGNGLICRDFPLIWALQALFDRWMQQGAERDFNLLVSSIVIVNKCVWLLYHAAGEGGWFNESGLAVQKNIKVWTAAKQTWTQMFIWTIDQ